MIGLALLLQATVTSTEIPQSFVGFYAGDQKMCSREGRFGFELTATAMGNGLTEARVLAVKVISEHAIEVTTLYEGDSKPIVSIITQVDAENITVADPDIAAQFPNITDAGVSRFYKCPLLEESK